MIYKGLSKSTCLVLCGKIRSDWGPHITFTSRAIRANTFGGPIAEHRPFDPGDCFDRRLCGADRHSGSCGCGRPQERIEASIFDRAQRARTDRSGCVYNDSGLRRGRNHARGNRDCGNCSRYAANCPRIGCSRKKATDSCGCGAFRPPCSVILPGHGKGVKSKSDQLAFNSRGRSAVGREVTQPCCHKTSLTAVQEMKRRRLRRHRARSEP